MQTSYAKENEKNYFVGLMRQINSTALIHADYAPFDAPGWSIGEINAQLAWNLCVVEPESGGDCIVHNKKWEREDEALKQQNSYGYSREVVDNTEKFLIKVKVGDAYLFNSRNFHEVTKSSGTRTTVSSFIGRTKTENLIMWS